MAGYLPDVSGIRLPFATDGTYVTYGRDSSGYSPVAANSVTAMANGETSDNFAASLAAGGTYYVSFVFPEPRNLTGISINWTSNDSETLIRAIDISLDTTDGINGTWENNVVYNGESALPGYNVSSPYLRQNEAMFTRSGVIGLRMRYRNTDNNYTRTIYVRSLNIYTTYTYAGLNFWHPTLDQALPGAYFDFGDVTQGQQYTKQFRLKNTATQLASNVVISSSAGFGAMGSNLTFSNDDTTYQASVNIASINSSTISGIHYVKRTVGVAETTSVANMGSIRAIATNWVG